MEEIIREGSLRLLATESSCDVILSCNGYKLMAHKIILSIASPVLQELLQQDLSQPAVLIFPDITSKTMTLILDYIYTGHVSLQLPQVTEFLAVAGLLKLKLEEDYVKLLAGSCTDLSKCDLKLFCCYNFEETKFDMGMKKKKELPGLIPISRRGLFNKVFPSPWTPRDEQVLEDPRMDCVAVTNSLIQHRLTSNEKTPEVVSLNDSNNNKVELQSTKKNVESKEKDLNKKEKRYKCEDCGKGFSQLRNYKYHRSIHDGTKEFSTRCPECGKTFNDKGYLSSHMKIHRDRKEYACQHCPKRFNQRVAYNMHLRIHTGVKPHECSDCGKSFSRKMLLKQHQRVHTGERPYTCEECGKSFADRSNMSLHARLHTGVKPYSCNLCPKSFTKKHHLKTHMNFHTGLKPYKCDKCGLAFSQSSNMRTHYKKCVLKTTSSDT